MICVRLSWQVLAIVTIAPPPEASCPQDTTHCHGYYIDRRLSSEVPSKVARKLHGYHRRP